MKYRNIRPDPERLRPLMEFAPPTTKPKLQRALGMFAYYAKWIPKFSEIAKPLYAAKTFPLSEEALGAFEKLKDLLGEATLTSISDCVPFIVECDASDIAISATLNQNGKPVAFLSRMLNKSEVRYPAVEKEATAIIEAVRKWRHLLQGRHFTIITDQRSVAFMMDGRRRTKIKNDKIHGWRIELASFDYDVRWRPGCENVAPDTLTRTTCVMAQSSAMRELHIGLCHPGVTRMLHFVRSKNLPYSTEEVREVCSSCNECSTLKPKFYKPEGAKLVKASRPMERLSVDFKGPVPSRSKNRFIFTAIDEFSRFPFAIPCQDTSADTVVRCLETIFSLTGMPEFVHSDRGAAFLSAEVREFLTSRGGSTSKTTPYNPREKQSGRAVEWYSLESRQLSP